MKNVQHLGRIIGLPGESIRVSLKTSKIYIKKDNKAYRLRETYLKRAPFTTAVGLYKNWTNLTPDQYFILPVER